MLPILFHLDANAVNARQRDPNLNELEQLASIGVVELEFSETAYREASHGEGLREAKAEQSTWAGLSHQPEFEDCWRTLIADAVFPHGIVSERQRNDVEVLLTAKLAGALLITTDGDSKTQPRGILGSKRELEALGISVVTPAEALALVKTNRTSQ
jgi:hypothetical protein